MDNITTKDSLVRTSRLMMKVHMNPHSTLRTPGQPCRGLIWSLPVKNQPAAQRVGCEKPWERKKTELQQACFS